MHDAFYDQFDFKPKVNTISASLAKTTKTVDELAHNARNKYLMDRLKQQAMEEEAQILTFKPVITAPFKSIVNPAAVEHNKVISKDPVELSRKIDDYRREKNQKLEEARRAQEYAILKVSY